MQNANFYAMLYRFSALKRGLHHFTALKWCSANAAARRSASEVARAIQRAGRAYTRRQAESWRLGLYARRRAGSCQVFMRVGKLAKKFNVIH